MLFLNHPEADYGEYFLYNGLCELVGAENVWDFPYKKSYHGEFHTYDRPWCSDGIGCTGPFEFAVPRKVPEHNLQEVTGALTSGQISLVVVGSPRQVARGYAASLRPLINAPIVLHDGEDYEDIDFYGIANRCGIKLVLKREFVDHKPRPPGITIKPFPFSCALPRVDADKTVDVLLAVGESHPARAVAREVVERINARVLCGHWGWTRYAELIAQSKIAVAPRGHGHDTVRRWDIPAFNTLLMCERTDLIEDNPLRDGEHCVYYSGPNELRDKLTWWVEHDAERERVARAGQDFVRQHHTNVARARRMLDWVVEVYG